MNTTTSTTIVGAILQCEAGHAPKGHRIVTGHDGLVAAFSQIAIPAHALITARHLAARQAHAIEIFGIARIIANLIDDSIFIVDVNFAIVLGIPESDVREGFALAHKCMDGIIAIGCLARIIAAKMCRFADWYMGSISGNACGGGRGRRR